MKKRINLSASSLVGEMEGLGGPLGAREGGGVFEGTRAFGSPGRPLEIGEGSLGVWGSFGSLGAFEDQRRTFGGFRGPLETGGGPLWVWWTFVDGGGPLGARVWLFGVWGGP